MEDTNALVANLVQTRSIERVLANISAQVSQLIILNEAYEQGDKDAFPDDLVSNAAPVKQATEEMANVGRRLARESHDQEMKLQMPRACDLLDVAGQNFVTASQRVYVENFSRESRRHLVRMAKDILEGTLKVLLVTDEAQVRKLVRSADWVMSRLKPLTAVNSMKDLVPSFKGVTEAVMLLTSLADKRQAELTHPRQRERIITAMTMLKKTMPMLSSSMQTFVKYPDNEQAKASKEYVIGQVLECVNNIMDAAQNCTSAAFDDDDEEDHPGSFISSVDKVIFLLSPEQQFESCHSTVELDIVTESAMRHSMAVAHLAAIEHRNLIIKNCQRVLHQKGKVLELGKSSFENPEFQELKCDFEEACSHLVEEFQDLERHVNAAILQLIVDAFCETQEPMERLVKAAVKPSLQRGPSGDASSHTSLEPLIEAFHVHSDRMCQVARFTAASSADCRRVRVIRGCVRHLEHLDPELVPATLAYSQDPGNHGALAHLKLLKREWEANVTLLISTVDEILDSVMFIKISELQSHADVSLCKASLQSETTDIAEATRILIGRSRRISQVATKLVDNSSDPVFRNGVMVYINHLNKVIAAVKSSANKVLSEPGILQRHQTLHKRCDILARCALRVYESLNGSHLPDVLSDVRNDVRPLNGLRSLDFSDEGEEDDDKLDPDHVIKESGPSVKMSKSPDTQRHAVALKTYVAELTDSDLLNLIRTLTAAAVAGEKAKVDVLCNDVMARTNHIVEVANNITGCEAQYKESLPECASDILSFTPQILEKSHQVAQCDVSQVEPLHGLTDQWARAVCFMESKVDGILDKWKAVANKVVDAARLRNTRLLTAEVQHLEVHRKQVTDLVATATQCTAGGDILAEVRVASLGELVNDFESLTTMLVTMADILSSSANHADKLQLEVTGRDWAVKVYCIMAVIDNLAAEAVQDVLRHAMDMRKNDFTQIHRDLAKFTHETIRTKGLVASIISSSPSTDKVSMMQGLCDDLDRLLSEMDDCANALTHVSAPYTTTEKLYAPHKMSLLIWLWALKMQRVGFTLDEVCGEFSSPLRHLVATAENLLVTSPGGNREELCSALARSVESIKSRFVTARGKLFNSLHSMTTDLDHKAAVKTELDRLDKLTQELTAAARKYAECPDKRQLAELVRLKHLWACTALQLDSKLSQVRGANTSLIAEARKVLKTVDDSADLEVKVTPEGKVSTLEGKVKPKIASTQPGKTVTFAPSPKSPAGRSSSTDNSGSPGGTTSAGASPTVLQKLMMGPKVQHQTPERPSPGSGYQRAERKTPRSVSTAARQLQLETDQWEEDNNAIVRLAKEMSRQIHDMVQFTKHTGEGSILNKEQLIETARAVAKNGNTLVKFAKILAEHCVDKRFAKDLMFYADHVPSVSTQLSILASVKAATPEDSTAEKMLVKNAENLLDAVAKMLHAAEATCVKGLHQPDNNTEGETEAIVLATQWQRKVQRHRLNESMNASMDSLGLRRVKRNAAEPTLSNMVSQK